MRAVVDIEANGHLEEADRIWCGSFYDVDSHETHTIVGLEGLSEAILELEYCIGHNLTGYDFPLLEKLTGACETYSDPPLDWCFDTYEASLALQPERPQKHSVEGWARYLGLPPKVNIKDWNDPDKIDLYVHRCERDVYIEYRIAQALLREMGLMDYSELIGC